jgi:selenocysteine-specific elongation factor
VIIGTAGHIDHGKTTLVHALTGVDTDRLPEEKRRGITIELGFAPLSLDGVGVVGVVDVPGHEAFVRTMVAGATGIDIALLVVAADEGVMPQTREHLAILGLLGVTRGVVALTKADLVDDEWLALVEEDVRAAIAPVLVDAPVVSTAARSGRGIAELRDVLAALARSVPSRSHDDLFRLPVDRAFTIKGTGTVVTGTVWSGRVVRDDTVRIFPAGKSARVRGLQGHGEQLDASEPGGRTAVALIGIEPADVPRGSTVIADRNWRPTTLARADITLVAGVEASIRPRTWFRAHVGTSEVGARVVAREVRAGAPFSARVVFDQEILIRAGDRFVLRTSAPLNTIGGGVIVDPYPPRRARPWPPGLDAAARLGCMVDEAGLHGVDLSTLPVRLGAPPAVCASIVESFDGGRVVSGRLIQRSALTVLREGVAEVTAEYHAANQLELGIPVQQLRDRALGGLGSRSAVEGAEVVDALLGDLVAEGRLSVASGLVAVAGWSPKPTEVQASLLKTLVSQLESGGAEPPSIEEIEAAVGVDPRPLVRYLERAGQVVQVEQNRYYGAGQLQLLIERLRGAMAGGAERSPADLRDALGLSRKFLIPFLEYCDRAGKTRRTAGGRVWGGP